MSPVRFSIEELSEMIQLSDKDEGMADLLSKAKEYYLLRRPEQKEKPKSPFSWFADDPGPY